MRYTSYLGLNAHGAVEDVGTHDKDNRSHHRVKANVGVCRGSHAMHMKNETWS